MYNTILEDTITAYRSAILANEGGNGSSLYATLWFDNMTEYVNILHTIEIELTQRIAQNLDERIATAGRKISINACILIIVIVVSPIIIYLVISMTSNIQEFVGKLKDTLSELNKEKKRTEILLFQMLPKAVASKLTNREAVEPETFAEVTVFFSNIVDFDKICSQITPIQVVHMLNSLYQTCDSKIDLYDVYKIETIGKSAFHCLQLYRTIYGLRRVRYKYKYKLSIGTLLFTFFCNLTEAFFMNCDQRWPKI